MVINTSRSLWLIGAFIALLILLINTQLTVATSSQCRGPSDQQAANKRGATTLEIDEMIEAELLNAHVELSAQGLNAEDLEYFTQLTIEHAHNTLFLRRAFRRIGRALRRIGRAIGRAFRAIGGIFRRRRAREIIMNSVASFNGYTGPNRESLEMRRPFIGGGVQKQTAVAASTLFFRRRRRSNRRQLVNPIAALRARGIAAVRAPAAIRAPRVAAAVIGRKIGRRRSSRRNIGSVFRAIGKRISSRIRSVVSKVKGSLENKMKALENKYQGEKSDGKPVNCVACRVDCLKSYSTLKGSMFNSCGERYYYYGCQAVSPCMKTSTSSDDEIEGMIGICAYRNNCKFKGEWAKVGEDQVLADRLVGRVRGSGQDPE